MDWLAHPAVQGGVAPLVVALAVAGGLGVPARLGRTPLLWLAVVVAYCVTTALATGFSLTPLTASRKIVLIGVAAALIGLALDLADRRSARVPAVLVGVSALAAVWAFWSVIGQREGAAAAALAAGVAVFAALSVLVMLRVGDDGLRAAAAGVGLGVGTGVSAVLSASIGFLLSGMAIGASCAAVLIVQVLARRAPAARHVAALSVALPCALFAEGAMLLAEMPWFVLPLLLLVPLGVAWLPAGRLRPMARASLFVAAALVIAIIPIAAAFIAARASST